MTLGIFLKEYILMFLCGKRIKRILQSKGTGEHVHSKADKQKTSMFILPEKETIGL